MDKIWDRKSFEVGGHWPLWRGLKKRNGLALKKTKKQAYSNVFHKVIFASPIIYTMLQHYFLPSIQESIYLYIKGVIMRNSGTLN